MRDFIENTLLNRYTVYGAGFVGSVYALNALGITPAMLEGYTQAFNTVSVFIGGMLVNQTVTTYASRGGKPGEDEHR